MKSSRRSFIKSMALLKFDPLHYFIQATGVSLLQKARAEEKYITTPRRYVLINAGGGIAKWMFDNPLRPNLSDPFVEHPLVCTQFSQISSDPNLMKFSYTTTQVMGIEMPHLWKFDVPAPRGKSIAMKELLHNMIMIRGCRMGSDGHANNARKSFAPVPGGYSISGVVADHAQTPIPAVDLIGFGGFATSIGMGYKAPGKTSLISVPREKKNKFNYLFQSFNNNSSKTKNPFQNKNEASAAIEEFLQVHERRMIKDDKIFESLFKDRINAKRLFKRKINDFAGLYEENVKKYQDLIERSLRGKDVEGLTDQPIPGFTKFKEIKDNSHYDMSLGHYANKEYYLGNNDLRDLFKYSEIQNLAEQFSITEFLLTQNIGTFIGINLDMISNLFYENSIHSKFIEKITGDQHLAKYKVRTGNTVNHYTGVSPGNFFFYDSHKAGTIPTLLSCSLVFRALSSCLLELISQLKKTTIDGKNLFDETLIQFSTEFGRDPRPDCAGSEHGWNGYNTSLYCGAFSGPHVLGNIYSTSKNTGSYYKLNGTWGDAAPVDGLGGKYINIRNVASTISEILRVESLTPNNQPLLTLKDDKLQLLIEKGKNVQG